MHRILRQLAAAAVVGIAMVTPAPAADALDGEAIVRARCTGCHNLDKLKRLASRTAEDQRAAKLETFLSFHNAPKADERAAVIAWLLVFTKPAESPAASPAPPAPVDGATPGGATPAPDPGMGGGTDMK